MLRAVAILSDTRIICTVYSFPADQAADMSLPPRNRFKSYAIPSGRGTLKDHLAVADEFARLSEQAERLRRLQNMLDAVLPAHLAPGTHIANLKRGKVVIHAASGAVAVKLRQMAPRLAEGFIQQGHEVTGIEVRVQGRSVQQSGNRKKTPAVLGKGAKQSLTSLHAGLDGDSPLSRALTKLLANA
jgi:hypothetical protein